MGEAPVSLNETLEFSNGFAYVCLCVLCIYGMLHNQEIKTKVPHVESLES